MGWRPIGASAPKLHIFWRRVDVPSLRSARVKARRRARFWPAAGLDSWASAPIWQGRPDASFSADPPTVPRRRPENKPQKTVGNLPMTDYLDCDGTRRLGSMSRGELITPS